MDTIFIAIMYVCSNSIGCFFSGDDSRTYVNEKGCEAAISHLAKTIVDKVPDAQIKWVCMPMKATKV